VIDLRAIFPAPKPLFIPSLIKIVYEPSPHIFQIPRFFIFHISASCPPHPRLKFFFIYNSRTNPLPLLLADIKWRTGFSPISPALFQLSPHFNSCPLLAFNSASTRLFDRSNTDPNSQFL
jgi:hypothetical protein